MAFCTSCGSKLDDDARFCTECGAPVTFEQGTISNEAASTSSMTGENEPPSTVTMGSVTSSDNPSTTGSTPDNGRRPLPQGAIIGIIAGVIVVALAIIIIIAVSSGSPEDEVTENSEPTYSEEATMIMPDLDGMTEENALSVLGALGLSCDVEYIDDSSELVLEQIPESGTVITGDADITITVGNGKSSVTSQMGKARTVELTVANPRNGQLVSADIRLDSNDDVIPDLLSRQYTVDEIRAMGLSDAELYIARNSIVAKSGYIFHYEPNTQFFIDNCAWYNPSSSEYQLQGIGAVNAGVIREVEASHGSWYLEIK